MDYTGYQLENAQRKLTDLYHEADHTALVEELKNAKKELKIPAWRKLVGQSLIKLGKRLDSSIITR